MLSLSRLILNPRSRRVWRDLADCQEMHRTVMSAFPQRDGSARAACGVLYRVELRDLRRPQVLVQSRVEPDWSDLPEAYLLRLLDNPGVRSLDPVIRRLDAGNRLRFRLHANPTKRVAAAPDAGRSDLRGKRMELRRPEEQEAWLHRKAEDGGFELVSVQARPDVANVRTVPNDRRLGHRDGSLLTFGAVTFDGVLRVVDADRFRETLHHGIGSGKAYGFGLLSVAPLGVAS